jgi:hypothetical protein
MRVIQVVRADRIEVFEGPTEAITPELMNEIMAPARENQLRVVEAAGIIEYVLETIINYYFFGDSPSNPECKIRFQSLVLSSDWCTFNVKRRLVMHIVNETDALKGKAKNDFDSDLKKAISYRNAFVHGTFSTDGRMVRLAYFEGTPRCEYLDDEFLQNVERAFTNCFNDVHRVAYATGAMKRCEDTDSTNLN